MPVRVQTGDFDIGHELAQIRQGRTDIGALVSFSGLVRDLEGSELSEMTLEHYPGMTEKALRTILRQAENRWDLQAGLIIHRYGTLVPGDQIMMVAAASRHRQAAFKAAEFMMDYLKSRAPFWKKEKSASRTAWVAARVQDDDARNRWDKKDE